MVGKYIVLYRDSDTCAKSASSYDECVKFIKDKGHSRFNEYDILSFETGRLVSFCIKY